MTEGGDVDEGVAERRRERREWELGVGANVARGRMLGIGRKPMAVGKGIADVDRREPEVVRLQWKATDAQHVACMQNTA